MVVFRIFNKKKLFMVFSTRFGMNDEGSPDTPGLSSLQEENAFLEVK